LSIFPLQADRPVKERKKARGRKRKEREGREREMHK
jgi:hypothetical protein